MKVLPVPVASVSKIVRVARDGFKDALDGDVLIVASLKYPPCLRTESPQSGRATRSVWRRSSPQFFRSRVMRLLAFGPLVHVYAVDALSVGRVGKANLPACPHSFWLARRLSQGASQALASTTASLVLR